MKRGLLALSFISWIALMAIGATACERAEQDKPGVTAALGVFYGGQVRELLELEVGPLRPTSLGFRLTFAEPSAHERQVHAEILRPGPGGRRVSVSDDFSVPGTETVFDRPIPVPPDAELGTWNVRVECDGVLVLDRAIRLRR